MDTTPIEPGRHIARLKKQFRMLWAIFALLIVLSFAIFKISWATDTIVILSNLASIIILAKVMRSYQLLKASGAGKRNKLFIVSYSTISAFSIFAISAVLSSPSRLYHDLQIDPQILLQATGLFAVLLILFAVKGIARKIVYPILIIAAYLAAFMIIDIALKDTYYIDPVFGIDRNFMSGIKCNEGEIWTEVTVDEDGIIYSELNYKADTVTKEWRCLSLEQYCFKSYIDCPTDICRVIMTPGMLIGNDYIGGSPPKCVPK